MLPDFRDAHPRRAEQSPADLAAPHDPAGHGACAAQTPLMMRYARSTMLEVLRQDYVTTARAKGLRERVVLLGHAFRNALIPLITVVGLSLPELLSGAVITETISSGRAWGCWPCAPSRRATTR